MTIQQQAAAKSLDTIASDLGITDRSAASRVYQAAFGAGTTEGIRLAGGVALSNRSDEEISDAVRRVQQISRDAGLTNEQSVVHAASAGGTFENGSQAGRRGSRDARAAYDTAVAYERQASSSFSEAQALRRAASIVARDGFSITGDDTYAIHRRAEAEGISRAAMNDPGVMMDVARRHFLEKYGASLGNPPTDLDPSAATPTVDRLSSPTFSNGEAASVDSVRRRSSSAQGEVSALKSAEGLAEDASPSLRDTASHFADSKRSAQVELEVRERRLNEDEQSLHSERARRQEGKSPFVDANPGRRPEQERPITTQWEFYTGDGKPPDDRP